MSLPALNATAGASENSLAEYAHELFHLGLRSYGCFGVVGAGVTGAGEGAGTVVGWLWVVRAGVVSVWSRFL